jgi:peroxiredoxin
LISQHKKRKDKEGVLALYPGMVVHTCDPSIGRLSQEDSEFKVSLNYIARSYLQKENRKEKQHRKEMSFSLTSSF